MKFSDNKTSQGNLEDEGIDFSEIKQKIIRNKKLVSLVTLGSFCLGLLYSFTREEIWRGKFQIVLSNNEPGNSSLVQRLSSKSKLSFGREKINTQVEILKSPSVLKPIFEKIKSERKSQGEKVDNLRYFKWLDKSIYVNRKRDTFVLDVFYKDSNRDRVIPTLVDISSTYQNFVNKGIKTKTALKINFLEDQVKIYKEKSSRSFKKAQDFALENDMAILDNKTIGDAEIVSVPDVNDDFLVNTGTEIRQVDSQLEQYNELLTRNLPLQTENLITNVEKIRIDSGKKIEEINRKINNIKSINDEIEMEAFVRSIIPLSKTLIVLDQLDIEISNKESIYKKNDKALNNLYRKRSNLIKQLEFKALGKLMSDLNIQESKIKSAIRPKGVITKYKELAREAEFDLNVFLITQKELRDQQVRFNSNSYPWQIITEPTLGDYPIYPQKRKIMLFFIFAGLLLGIIISLVKENQQGIIYSKDDFLKIFENNVLSLESSLPESEKESFIKLYGESIISNEKINCILPVGSISYEEVENIKSKFIKYCSNDLIIKREMFEILETDNVLLISKLGNVSVKDLSLFNNKTFIKGIKINWAILI